MHPCITAAAAAAIVVAAAVVVAEAVKIRDFQQWLLEQCCCRANTELVRLCILQSVTVLDMATDSLETKTNATLLAPS